MTLLSPFQPPQASAGLASIQIPCAPGARGWATMHSRTLVGAHKKLSKDFKGPPVYIYFPIRSGAPKRSQVSEIRAGR